MTENKQLYEKKDSLYNPFFPIARLEDIIETISDKSIQWILNHYNHIYVEYSESVTITRNKVPMLLRRTGLWISYNDVLKLLLNIILVIIKMFKIILNGHLMKIGNNLIKLIILMVVLNINILAML